MRTCVVNVNVTARQFTTAFSEFCWNYHRKLAAFWDSYIAWLVGPYVCWCDSHAVEHERATVVCTPLHPWNATSGDCIQQEQLCPAHVSLLVRNGVVATDPPLLQCVTCGRTVCSPAQRIRTSPVDQTIEQTMNRDSKTNGGNVGISLNRGAVQSWNLTAHYRWTSCKPAEKRRVCMMLPVSITKTLAHHEWRRVKTMRTKPFIRLRSG